MIITIIQTIEMNRNTEIFKDIFVCESIYVILPSVIL